jgi:hypothetical protein
MAGYESDFNWLTAQLRFWKTARSGTDKTVCLVQATEHYPECIDK